ncbi:hypothetical protein OG21DRAFT_122159 [Imleria badia]|nr:hypothetical protein OG21DRAFT_122159 [Imleria badia]
MEMGQCVYHASHPMLTDLIQYRPPNARPRVVTSTSLGSLPSGSHLPHSQDPVSTPSTFRIVRHHRSDQPREGCFFPRLPAALHFIYMTVPPFLRSCPSLLRANATSNDKREFRTICVVGAVKLLEITSVHTYPALLWCFLQGQSGSRLGRCYLHRCPCNGKEETTPITTGRHRGLRRINIPMFLGVSSRGGICL